MFTLFFFNDTATTEIYTLSLHDALPISPTGRDISDCRRNCGCRALYDRSSGGPSLPGCCGDESGRTGEEWSKSRHSSFHRANYIGRIGAAGGPGRPRTPASEDGVRGGRIRRAQRVTPVTATTPIPP